MQQGVVQCRAKGAGKELQRSNLRVNQAPKNDTGNGIANNIGT